MGSTNYITREVESEECFE